MHTTVDPIVVFIRNYIDLHGFPPSQREIGRACYLTVSGVNRRLQILAAQGHIEYTPKQARGIGLPQDRDPMPPAA